MDWKLIASTFGVVFVAEIGDKTQFVTLSLASTAASKWAVFAGAALALLATSGLAVIGGEVVSRAVPPIYLRRAAGLIFIALGIMYLVTRAD